MNEWHQLFPPEPVGWLMRLCPSFVLRPCFACRGWMAGMDAFSHTVCPKSQASRWNRSIHRGGFAGPSISDDPKARRSTEERIAEEAQGTKIGPIERDVCGAAPLSAQAAACGCGRPSAGRGMHGPSSLARGRRWAVIRSSTAPSHSNRPTDGWMNRRPTRLPPVYTLTL